MRARAWSWLNRYVAYFVDIVREDLQQRELVHAQVAEWAAQNNIEIQAKYRMAGLAGDNTGMRTLIEFAPNILPCVDQSGSVIRVMP